uniref:Copia protein n=1 Tax=Cajanus cajan TaxID=3821 RepID=A0A151RVQ1_CAJCA|nr:Copia protein [Cajanus cajan]
MLYKTLGLKEADHSVFYCHTSPGRCVYLIVYVDDIVITGNDVATISQLKKHLFSHFQTKDQEHLKYFLGIEVSQSKEGIVISQRKYRRLVGKLIYLTITRPDLSFAVGLVSQFMQAPHIDHWNVVLRILRYIKRLQDKDYYMRTKEIIEFLDTVIKKQNVVAQSSVEAEYQAMALITCEFIRIKQLIQELRFCEDHPMKLYCDNQAALHIASDPVFHERTKHIEVDCHFGREKLLSKEIITEFVNSSEQLADVMTNSLRGPRIQFLCSKLGSYNLYAPT